MRWKLLITCLLQAAVVSAQDVTPSFKSKIEEATHSLRCDEPSEQNPVTVNAVLVSANGTDSIAVVVKSRIAPGWHFYAYVPDTMPYITSACVLRPDANVKPIGTWEKSRPSSSAMDRGVLLYEKEAVFIQKLKKVSRNASGTISAGLYYQTCNLRQCLPPIEKTIELKY